MFECEQLPGAFGVAVRGVDAAGLDDATFRALTEALYRQDAYLRDCTARVVAVNDRGGIVLDRNVFYPTGGGQPGDSGALVWEGGETPIAVAVKGDTPDEVVHVPAEGALAPAVGTEVEARLDWERRYRPMRMHTCLHLLCAVVPGEVTGGQISDGKGRLDFNLPDRKPEKEPITAALNRLVNSPLKRRHPSRVAHQALAFVRAEG